jgi:adenylosuccinate lyase
MNFHLFEKNSEAYLRKSREYLEEANLARVEHQAAAEHHAALAKMYAERIARIEAEINHALQPRVSMPREAAPEESERSKSESVVVYPSRTTRP